jgi:transcription initiation factor IIE alpha subunit
MEEKDYIKMGTDYCPNCNYQIDCASAVEGNEAPNPHDVSICINCGEWLEYSDDMALIRITERAIKELSDKDLFIMKEAQAHIRKRGIIKR